MAGLGNERWKRVTFKKRKRGSEEEGKKEEGRGGCWSKETVFFYYYYYLYFLKIIKVRMLTFFFSSHFADGNRDPDGDNNNNKFFFFKINMMHSFKIQSSFTWRVDLSLELGRVEEKIRKKKSGWPGNLINRARPGQKPDCNLLIFIF